MKRIPYPAEARRHTLQCAQPRFTSVTDTQLLIELISQVEVQGGPLVICEIGCNEGFTTRELAHAFPDAIVIGIDHPWASCPHQKESPQADRFCENACSLPNVIPIYKDMASMPDIPGGIDVAFVDGDHTRAGCIRDTEWAIRNGAELIVWHDYGFPPPSWFGVNETVSHYGGTSVADSGVAFVKLPRRSGRICSTT